MGKARSRHSIDDIFDELDAVMTRKRPVIEEPSQDSVVPLPPPFFSEGTSNSCSPLQPSESAFSSVPPHLAQQSVKPPPAKKTRPEASSSQSPSQPDSDAPVFLSELAMLQRKDEDAADMALFLATSLTRATNCKPLLELVDFLYHNESVLGTLRKLGQISGFIDRIVQKPISTFSLVSEVLASYAELLRYLSSKVPFEAMSTDQWFKAVISIVDRKSAEASITHAKATTTTGTSKLHWSQRPTSRTAAAAAATASDPESGELLKAVENLIGHQIDSELFKSTAIDILINLVLAHNQVAESSPTIPSEGSQQQQQINRMASFDGMVAVTVPGPVILFRCGGFSAMKRVIEEGDEELVAQALQLLEVATCCPELAGEQGIKEAFGELFALLVAGKSALLLKESSTLGEEAATLPLRVAINVTSLLPEVAPTDTEACRDLGAALATAWMQHDLTSDASTCCACLAINLLKRGGNNELRWALLDHGGFLDFLAQGMKELHQNQGVTENVSAGYFSVVLACLALHNEEARVRIVTAISRVGGDGVQHKPMMLVVAIIQEFILFQSSAGILTKDTLVSLHKLLQQTITENNIEAEIPSDFEEDGDEQSTS